MCVSVGMYSNGKEYSSAEEEFSTSNVTKRPMAPSIGYRKNKKEDMRDMDLQTALALSVSIQPINTLPTAKEAQSMSSWGFSSFPVHFLLIPFKF